MSVRLLVLDGGPSEAMVAAAAHDIELSASWQLGNDPELFREIAALLRTLAAAPTVGREELARALRASAEHQVWGVAIGQDCYQGHCECGWFGQETSQERARQDAALHAADALLAALAARPTPEEAR